MDDFLPISNQKSMKRKMTNNASEDKLWKKKFKTAHKRKNNKCSQNSINVSSSHFDTCNNSSSMTTAKNKFKDKGEKSKIKFKKRQKLKNTHKKFKICVTSNTCELRKHKRNMEELDQLVENPSSKETDQKSKTITTKKKLKKKLMKKVLSGHIKNPENLVQLNLENESEDSENDIEIRKELGNLLAVKKINKLLKNNPSLCFETNIKEKDSVEAATLFNSDKNMPDEYLTEIKDLLQVECPSDSNKPISVNSSRKIKNLPATKMCSKTSKKRSAEENSLIIDTASATRSTEIRNFGSDPIQTSNENSFHRDRQNKLEKNNSFRNKAQEKLQAAKFRYLNEKLYTESGKESYAYFQNNKDEFLDYHNGYSLQVSKWPMNPVDKIIISLQKLKKNLVIADMGCGDAKIARTLKKFFTIHSYDLVALNEHVIPCNISKVPLSNESVDVVVFCLSLMGTNLKDYLREAHRILKLEGSLKIAEVESRISNIDQFIKSIEDVGFQLTKKDLEHKIFVFLDLIKVKKKRKKGQDIVMNPCLYKKR